MPKQQPSWLVEGLAALAIPSIDDVYPIVSSVAWSQDPYATERDGALLLVVAKEDEALARTALARLPELRAAAHMRAKALALQDAIGMIGEISAPVMKGYTAAERESWAAQDAEARKISAGGTAADAPLLADLARQRGVTLAALAEIVLAKSAGFRAIAATEQALRREAEAALGKASTPDEIAAALATVRAAVAAHLQPGPQ